MESQTETLRPEIDELLALVRQKSSSDRGEVLTEFARAMTRRLSEDELAQIPCEQLLALIESVLALTEGRGSKPSAVRCYNPDLKRDGYEALGTVLETNVEDSPFIVDSVREELASRNLEIRRFMHPVIGTERAADGRITKVTSAREAEHRESVMHIEVDRVLSDETCADLASTITDILRDVGLVVRDFEPMEERVRQMADMAATASGRYSAEEVRETVNFLRWLLELNFVMLGYREYRLIDTKKGRAVQAVEGTGLGILSDVSRSAFAEPVLVSSLEPAMRKRVEGGDLLVFSKTNHNATVHRRARMDYIGVRHLNEAGEIVGESRLVGLFTSKAYMEPASETPLLHGKLESILAAEDLIPDSHDYKEAVRLFESFPKDELFQASTQELRHQVVGLLQLDKHGGIRVLVRRDMYGRSVNVTVALPKDRFNADLRKKLQQLFVETFNGSAVDYHLALGEGDYARIYFDVHVEEGKQIPEGNYEELEAQVEDLARTWDDDLLDALAGRFGQEQGATLAAKYSASFPDYYKSSEEWGLILDDVEMLERLASTPEGFLVGIGNEQFDDQPMTRVKLYKRGSKVELSSFMPIIENLGLRAIEEVTTDCIGDEDIFIHDFGVLERQGNLIDLEATAGRIAETITAVWRGQSESDSLNGLVSLSDLDWRQVSVLRAYRKYRQRVSANFTEEYQNEAFHQNPTVSAALIRLFEAKFDPDSQATPADVEAIRKDILAQLSSVTSLDQDRILRAVLGTIEATVRTNAYLDGRSCLSMKLRSAQVPDMPKPYPMVEIFAYSPGMEAIHLRGGRVARGGIRWSDRKEDYRTEVLGLMKAQKVKNAIIVPDGSKGGFVLKKSFTDVAELKAEVVKQYVSFMEGMLDITDNLVDGQVVHPDGVKILDGEDPYLVVAADKGTATFSDTANSVSERYGFWLGDAFASGGSQGYDHKALGITARGAWESVKRHFRELGIDVMKQPVTVVGIGDMSGDVFGNGMLLSEHIQLVCAFDHRNVFVDPTPDTAKSFAERKRLYEKPGSSWADYNASLISKGGEVFDRKAKSIKPSAQVRQALGISDEVAHEMTPDELITRALKAPVDLLWNGGIGTYVKASTETHADAGDRTNDVLRVDGRDLRARVVGEGGNLGFTQRGRIEYAMSGGRINTDFIDNSAGVDTSDHEVNLKILLGLAVQRGELTMEQRNTLLQECVGDVVAHVLYDNYLQAQILSQEVELSHTRIEAYEELMVQLESEGELEREVEFLPSTEQMLQRRANGEGMARPELAVLLAYAKRSTTAALLQSDLPDSPYLAQDLRRYFPTKVVERFDHLIPEHPLRRELVATMAANDVSNSQGVTFISRMVVETGTNPSDVVRAFRIARDVTGAEGRWEEIEALDGKVDPSLQNELMKGVDWLVETMSRWYLVRNTGQRLSQAVAEARESFAELSSALERIGPHSWVKEREEEAQRLVARGVPIAAARSHAFQWELVHAPDIITLAHQTDRPVSEIGRGFFLMGEKLDLDWLESRLDEMGTQTRWQRWAQQSLEDDLFNVRRLLVEKVISESPEGTDIDEATQTFLLSRSAALGRLQKFMRGLALEGINDIAQLTVALRQIRSLVG